jgi:hypothetical protein
MSRSTTMRLTRASSARSARLSGREVERACEGKTMPLARTSRALGLALILVGCASYGPGDLRPRASGADVRARMGAPTGRYPLPGGGSELEYARGPMGKHTYMIGLDAGGRVQGWQQVLTEANFDTLAIGAPQADVRNLLGRPSETRVGWRGVGQVWSYRYESLFCCWFQVWLVDHRVREASYADDPTCEDHRRDNDL